MRTLRDKARRWGAAILTNLVLLAALLAASLAALFAALPAAAGENAFAGYFHTSWTPSDGAPADIRRIAQDANGWLWLASQGGLYRFDGDRFERMAAIDGNRLHKSAILAVAVLDGALWVGYQFGGIERFKDGVATYFDEGSGLARGSVYYIVQARGGRVTAALPSGVYEFDGARWANAWPGVAAPDALVPELRVGPDNAVYFSSARGGASHIYRRGPGEQQYVRVDADDDNIALAEGAFWGIGETSGWMPYDPASKRFVRRAGGKPVGDGANLFVQRDGTTWVNNGGDGIELVADSRSFKTVAQFTRAQGLSDANIIVEFEDREGNLWLGTGGGLDRLRPTRAHTVEVPKDTRFPGLVPLPGGAMWLSSSTSAPLRRIAANGAIEEHGVPSALFVSAGRHGAVWAANRRTLARFANGTQQEWELPPPLTLPQSVAEDKDGGLWVSLVSRRDLYRLTDGQWVNHRAQMGFPETAVVLHFDDRERLWQAYTDDRLAVADGTSVTRYTKKDGLRTGNIYSISTRGGHVWIGGEAALMLLRGAGFVGVTAPDGSDFIGISGIVETANGDLWLHGLQGITRIGAAEVQRVLKGGVPRVSFERFDYKDGIIGQAMQLRPLPTLHEGPDGRIWYNTASTVGWIDPANERRNRLVPPVMVRALATAGASYAPAAGLRLPAGTDALRVDYAAPLLSMPEKMRFRYKLDGVDAAWVDAGARRSAYYTRLAAGDYHFHVQAVNEDGVWNTVGASQAFTIAPTLTQATWFRALCAAALLLALWRLHRWRLGRQAAQLRARMHARLDERTRIARELHDTLIQSVQGLVLKVHGAAVRLPAQEPVRGLLDAALVQAEDAITEGRNRVSDLRQRDDGADLLPLLEAVGNELAGSGGVTLMVKVTGRARALAPGVGGELFTIGREAIVNAYRHAQAGTITLVIDYGAQQMRLGVLDDGCGIPEGYLGTQGRAGHWGIAGMRERAARIGATLSLRAAPAGGTECLLLMPAAQAYAQVRARGWRGWWRACWR